MYTYHKIQHVSSFLHIYRKLMNKRSVNIKTKKDTGEGQISTEVRNSFSSVCLSYKRDKKQKGTTEQCFICLRRENQ